LRLINDILDFSKIEVGQLPLHDDVFDPRDTVVEAVRMVRGQAEAAGVALGYDAAGDAPLLRGDERRVRQVLLNLLSNAIKFTPRDGTTQVTLRRDGDGLAIAVAGTGIGLPLSERLMVLHGGTLAIESAVDRGTTVTMRFPGARVVTGNPAALIAA